MYDDFIVYGPYTRKDGRKHVVLRHIDTKELKTVSYPKFLMENHIGRYLEAEETVDHIDRNFNNNSIDNLKVINRSEHSKLDAKYLEEKIFFCPECKTKFVLSGKKLSTAISNNKKKKSGPFCSRRCAGRYGSKVQNSRIDKLKVSMIVSRKKQIDK